MTALRAHAVAWIDAWSVGLGWAFLLGVGGRGERECAVASWQLFPDCIRILGHARTAPSHRTTWSSPRTTSRSHRTTSSKQPRSSRFFRTAASTSQRSSNGPSTSSCTPCPPSRSRKRACSSRELAASSPSTCAAPTWRWWGSRSMASLGPKRADCGRSRRWDDSFRWWDDFL